MDTAQRVNDEGSALGRMFNVLAAPGEVFQEIKERPVNHANWLLPASVWAVVGIACVLLLFSNQWAMNEILRAQEKAMQQQVSNGKMRQADADKAQEMLEKYMPMIMKVGGAVMTLTYAFGVPFFWGVVIWLVGTKVFGADFEFMKAVEAAGLASLIYVLATVVATLAALAAGKLVHISAAAALDEFDFTKKQHFALAALNPFYIWYAAIVATALAKLSGASWPKAAAWCFGVWILSRAVLILLNMGQFTM
jgi:hypothetical protein